MLKITVFAETALQLMLKVFFVFQAGKVNEQSLLGDLGKGEECSMGSPPALRSDNQLEREF